MHALTYAFLALYLAHLATDFVLQSDRMVGQKKKGDWAGYAKHGAVHFITAVLSVGFASPVWLRTINCYGAIIGLSIIHLLIDRCKFALAASNRVSDSTRAFVLDQVLHSGTVLAAAWLIVRTPMNELISDVASVQLEKYKILLLLVVYVGAVFGGGYLVRYLTKPLLHRTTGNVQQTTDQLANAGLYIGWLERFLVLTALMLHSPATVGLILTAKSIARYPEFKSVRFAEYFLIGTLLSISIGILGGLLLLKVVYGTISLSK